MKKLSQLLFTLLLPAIMSAQSGKVFDNLSMKSTILDCEKKYAIYLPPDYESSQRSYPVLYLLHGAGEAGHISWVQFGEVLILQIRQLKKGNVPQ